MGRVSDFFDSFKKESGGTKYEMENETAFAVPYTNRAAWKDDSITQNLTPSRLAEILSQVKAGECPADYLLLAQDIELKDLHYRSVLGTRKDIITGLDIKVEAAGEDTKSVEIAEAVKADIVINSTFKIRSLLRDMLDALGKGFSVNELIWDTESGRWKPSRYIFRQSSWFQYDREDARTLKLRDPLGNGLHDLVPYKFIIYEPHLISGLQITAGFAFIALYFWMLKNYNISSWAAFIDRYGYPIRLGKYGKKSDEKDIATLKRAVASIGSDFGAVIPESAILEIIEAKQTGVNAQVYERLAVFVDKYFSKLILGQTMTTDEGSSRAQGQVHDEVRKDIADSDIEQLLETLNAQLVVPYVNFNFGLQSVYPKITLYNPDAQNIDQIISAVEKLGDKGFTVKADEIRNLLGLTQPKDGDEVIGGRVEYPQGAAMNAQTINLASQQKPLRDRVDEILADESENAFIEITEEIADVLEKAADAATDFESFKVELEKLVTGWKPNAIAKLMAIAFFKARAAGDSEFEAE